MKRLVDDLIVNAAVAAMVVGIILASYLFFTSDIGHAFLCDTPGSKACQ
jgi:hypothetical protein